MRIVFMGTPDYSVKTLEALINAGHNIVGVFAQPDKPLGRKQIITPPPVKSFALNAGIPVFQPSTLKNGEAYETIKSLAPDVIVVVAYGKILPHNILSLPKYGCINGHASLLPKYRGASPIQWAIVNGEKQTGVTTMLMDDGMDTGDILLTEKTDIQTDETAEQLFERLSLISANLMVKTLSAVESGTVTPVKQDETLATYAPIIKKEMAHIDFNKSANKICCEVRGYYSWPCAFFILAGKRIKVISAKPAKASYEEPGTVISNKDRFIISCGDGTSIELTEVQPEGSKKMSAAQMLCGNKVALGMKAE